MKPYYTDDWLTLYGGDCREVLASLPADSVDCVVTSPPYWGLRDYGTEGQLGLERTPEEYVANVVAVFREVRRVLKPSGTCWLNLGDSFYSSTATQGRNEDKAMGNLSRVGPDNIIGKMGSTTYRREALGLKPKDLVGIPWRVAFALQADGWFLRSDIIWSKPNPMPESVTDRPTKSHEYLFLLTKSPRYYFDADAVREDRDPKQIEWREKYGATVGEWGKRREAAMGRPGANSGLATQANNPGRNIRSVWNIATRPYPGAHFAVFPPELPERCIKAGSSEKGVCPECGAPWERVVERKATTSDGRGRPSPSNGDAHAATDHPRLLGALAYEVTTTGWRPTCTHDPAEGCQDKACPLLEKGVWGHPLSAHGSWGVSDGQPVPAVILDPFGGSGTVGMVANRLSRRAILIDLNPEYLKQQMTRNSQVPLGLTEGDAA